MKEAAFDLNSQICINIKSDVSVINDNLVSLTLIIKCFSLIAKEVCDMQISDHYVYVKTSLHQNQIEISVKVHLIINLLSDLILSMNFLKEQKVIIRLDSKIISLENIDISLMHVNDMII